MLVVRRWNQSNISRIEARQQHVDMERDLTRQRRPASTGHGRRRRGEESMKKPCFLRRRSRLYSKSRGVRRVRRDAAWLCIWCALGLDGVCACTVHEDERCFGERSVTEGSDTWTSLSRVHLAHSGSHLPFPPSLTAFAAEGVRARVDCWWAASGRASSSRRSRESLCAVLRMYSTTPRKASDTRELSSRSNRPRLPKMAGGRPREEVSSQHVALTCSWLFREMARGRAIGAVGDRKRWGEGRGRQRMRDGSPSTC